VLEVVFEFGAECGIGLGRRIGLAQFGQAGIRVSATKMPP
jgi:hypothetical protein